SGLGSSWKASCGLASAAPPGGWGGCARPRPERVAVQFPDELLAGAPELVSELQRSLPGCKVFILGDSTFGSSSVDEVGAEHFGADAIIHVGPSDQQHGCAVPVLFSTAPCAPPGAGALAAALRQEPPTSLVLLCDVSLQHAASELAAALKAQVPGLGDVLVAEPQLQAAGGSGSPARWRDWRFGALPLGSAWWASLGTATLAAAATPRPLRLCGREVRGAPGGAAAGLPDGCGVVLVAPPGGPLEGPLLLRHGCARPVWRLDPSGGGVERLCSTALLMQRYRLVELARAAGTFGLLVTPSYAAHVQAVADRLELLLRRSGRRVYRFVMGKVAAEKLGSYPAVECFVSLATPEHFPFVTKDLPVPIASPYELEVALGAREWTGDYRHRPGRAPEPPAAARPRGRGLAGRADPRQPGPGPPLLRRRGRRRRRPGWGGLGRGGPRGGR
ncbi:unnamed protein product, partial [Prorocentrum cordatum]